MVRPFRIDPVTPRRRPGLRHRHEDNEQRRHDKLHQTVEAGCKKRRLQCAGVVGPQEMNEIHNNAPRRLFASIGCAAAWPASPSRSHHQCPLGPPIPFCRICAGDEVAGRSFLLKINYFRAVYNARFSWTLRSTCPQGRDPCLWARKRLDTAVILGFSAVDFGPCDRGNAMAMRSGRSGASCRMRDRPARSSSFLARLVRR